MSKKTGGQAFPQPVAYTPMGQEVPSYPGMTLRDYFAGRALGAMIAEDDGNMREWLDEYDDESTSCAVLARVVYQIADAMLAERAK